jgi:membrane protein YdbS with pleckstrin-like domain
MEQAEVAMERLDRRVVPYWLLSGILSAVVFCALLVGGLAIVKNQAPDWFVTTVVAASVIGGMLVGWSLISPYLAYVRWRFFVDQQLMLMRYGIIFHEERTIPISRMQHVDLTRGPVERLFGLATLVVFTAGNEGSAFRLPGVAVDRAKQLRDQILAARGDDIL